MIRDHNFLKTVTGSKDHEAYVDELTVIAPQKLEMLKKRIEHKFQEVFLSYFQRKISTLMSLTNWLERQEF